MRTIFAIALCCVLCGCSDNEEPKRKPVSVVCFVGGAEDSEFSQIIANGARQAAADLDADLSLRWSAWDNDTMLLQFKQVVDEQPDGIAVMGHPGEDAFAPLITEARDKGIIVTTLNVDLPDSEARYAADGMGYAGQHIRASGVQLARACLRYFDLQPGAQVLVNGVRHIPIRGERSSAIVETLDAAGCEVSYIADDRDLERFADTVIAHLKAHPQTALVIDDCELTFLGRNLQKAGFAPDQFKLAGFDCSAEGLGLMDAGYIHLIADQQPWLQGYLAVQQVVLSERYGFSGLHIDTGGALIHAGNIDRVRELVAKGIR